MKIYHLKRIQALPISLAKAWDFFSSPKNLGELTPEHIHFQILSSPVDTMYAGQIIRYKIKLLPFWTVNWVTEITHVQMPTFFVDDQRFGPYAFWHHQHSFRETGNGVEMTDEVHYAIPYGFIGRLVHWLFVARAVSAIFDFRFQMLERHFVKEKAFPPTVS
jgi:ligand-binding SRPBCC domain-containing protein